ncbi:MAG: flagellar protein FlaG [Gammaproteobacteria bacterium]|nr:flagellar protein FlaG [Gammaproteobacteria bacterium]
MAIEISSIITANVPSSAKGTGQSVKLEAVKVPDASGKALPEEGKAVPQQISKQSISAVDIKKAVVKINSFVQNVQRDVLFTVDEGSGRTVIRVINRDGDLVRQIPKEEVLALASHLQEISDTVTLNQSNALEGLLYSDIA